MKRFVLNHEHLDGYRKGSHGQECLEQSKGGFTTKIHSVVDALGNPLKFILTPRQKTDFTQGEFLIKDLKVPRR